MASRRLTATTNLQDVFSVLGQSLPVATVLTDLYSAGSEVFAVISSIWVCNTGSNRAKFRISVAVAGAANVNSQYLFYDTPINIGDSRVAVAGITLGPDDVIRVYSDTGFVAFAVFGDEIVGG